LKSDIWDGLQDDCGWYAHGKPNKLEYGSLLLLFWNVELYSQMITTIMYLYFNMHQSNGSVHTLAKTILSHALHNVFYVMLFSIVLLLLLWIVWLPQKKKKRYIAYIILFSFGLNMF
jgi:cbb3-type cytochrome oxidase subunit 3